MANKPKRTLFDDSTGSDTFDPFKNESALPVVIAGKPKRIKKVIPTREVLQVVENRKNCGVMSLDIATNTGFCTHNMSGHWSFALKKGDSKGMRLIRFKSKLKEICEAEAIKIIVFEQIAIYGKFPNTVGIEMIGVLKLFCEENGIDYTPYPVKSIKVQTGNGNASKEQMIEFVQKFKPGVTSDDEADAIVLYHLALKDLKL
jgi:Holliday junction resolvasome RuvABC endonuclease subunit